MAARGTRNTTNSLNKGVLVISAAAGVVGSFVSGLIYRIISPMMWSPLAVGISFMIFAAVLIGIMGVVNLLNDNLGFHVSKFHDGGQIILTLIGFILGALILGTLFEFIYEMNFFEGKKGYQEPTSYVFLIDNSGSMDSSDPENVRYAAITQIISGKEDSFPYAVYGFSNGVEVMRELAPISAGNNELTGIASGGTEIRGTLTRLYEEYENGLKDQLGEAPKFLLLSDGYATDIGWFSSINKILKEYAKTNIEISTVGLGEADDELMQQIADDTGGVYISVNDVNQLEQSMSQAISKSGANKYARTLYTLRNVPSLNFLYALMRIVFTAILGVGISCSMLFATGKGDDSDKIVTTSIITGVLAGLALELLINGIPLPPNLVRYLYFILVALTFITEMGFGGNGRGAKYKDADDMLGGGGRMQMGGKQNLRNTGAGNTGGDMDDLMGGGTSGGRSGGASSGGSSYDDDFFNDF